MTFKDTMLEKYQSRKWQAFIAGFSVAVVFAATGIITGGEWVAVQSMLFGIISTADIFQKRGEIKFMKEGQ